MSPRDAVLDPSVAGVHAERISHSFGHVPVLNNVELSVRRGEFFTLLGPSGSGKTTLLRIFAGLLQPDHGRVIVGGRDVTGIDVQHRDIGFVFQHYALFPHLTVTQNVEFPLKLVRGNNAAERKRRVDEMLELVSLQGRGGSYPAELSGGQQQRVALARALIRRPQLLLLDEPLGALDRHLRQELGSELRRIQKESGTTAIYVTHDQEEAFILSDRLGVMREGELRQIGSPDVVYMHPDDPFVAAFLGEINWIPGVVLGPHEDCVSVDVGGAVLQCSGEGLVEGRRVKCAVRPEALSAEPIGKRINGTSRGRTQDLGPATLDDLRFLGQRYRLRLAWGDAVLFSDVGVGEYVPSQGESIRVAIPRPVQAFLVDPADAAHG